MTPELDFSVIPANVPLSCLDFDVYAHDHGGRSDAFRVAATSRLGDFPRRRFWVTTFLLQGEAFKLRRQAQSIADAARTIEARR